MFKKALFKNLLQGLVKHGKIKTTQAKAKVLRDSVDRVVNRAKEKSLDKRYLLSLLPPRLMERLVKEIAPRFSERKSGFTRTIKLGTRAGDNAPMVLMEWVEGEEKIEEKPVTTETQKEIETQKNSS